MILNEFKKMDIQNHNVVLGVFVNDQQSLIEDLSLIPNSQKEDIQRYKKKSDRIKRLIARSNTYKYLYENYYIKDFSLRYVEFGKLYLKKYQDIYFSFSYSKDYILVGISDVELGVDIEYIDTNIKVEDLADTIMHLSELNYFRGLSQEDKTDFFFKVFNIKEAIIKNIGTGLYYDVKKINTLDIEDNKYLIQSNKVLLEEFDFLDKYKVSICLTDDY